METAVIKVKSLNEELPKGWVIKTLKETCEMYQPKTISKKEMVDGGEFPVFGANGIIGSYDQYNHEEPQVLVTCRGATCGAVNLSKPYSWINGNAMVINSKAGAIDQSFLIYLLEGGIKLEKAITGTAQPQITRNSLEPLELPLPPLNEQKRIVAKIEELFSELDAGEQSLREARQKLTLYRQSLLKQAFEGKLTETWRQQNPDKLEDPKTLLARIQQERESRHQQQLQTWQQAVEQWEHNGKAGKKPSKPRITISKGIQPNSKLTELPKDWIWVSIDELSSVGTGKTPLKARTDFYENGTIPWITSTVVNNAFVKKPNSYVTELALAEQNLKLFPEGSLIVALYGEGKTRGMVSETKFKTTTNQALAVIVQFESELKTKSYLKAFLFKNYTDVRRLSSGGVQPNLNVGLIQTMPVPLPSLPEQQEIVRLLDEQFTAIQQNEKEITHSLTQSQALRQSILKKAFSGKLV